MKFLASPKQDGYIQIFTDQVVGCSLIVAGRKREVFVWFLPRKMTRIKWFT